MSEVEIRQRAALEGRRGGRRGQEGQPAPPYRTSWSTVYCLLKQGLSRFSVNMPYIQCLMDTSDSFFDCRKKSK